MSEFTLKPHTFERIEGTQQYRLTKVIPYVRLGNDNESVFLQAGKMFYVSGEVVKTPPAWVKEEMGKMTAKALAEVGFESKVN